MARYSENGNMVSCDCESCTADREANPVAALNAAIAEHERRVEQGIYLIP
jgi:hypothetical protein